MTDTEAIVSISLLKKKPSAPLSKEEQKRFCLGLKDWCPCDFCGGRLMETSLTVDAAGKSRPLCLKLKRKRPVVSNVVDLTVEEDMQGELELFKNLSGKSKKVDDSRRDGVEEDMQRELEIFESLSGKSKKVDDSRQDGRFLFNVTLEDLNKFKEGESPANTIKNNMWALKNFQEWRVARNEACPSDFCPDDILLSSKKHLCDWLCKFVSETRKSDGTEYTPRSLYLILCGLQRHVRSIKSEEINFFQDIPFKPLRNVCDSVFKRLHNKGIGAELKATPVISINEEDRLWEKKVLDLDTPIGLLRAVFFTMESISV